MAASAVSIVSGWATSVVATDLIAGWWRSDRLFCVAVAFLALVFALATVSGVILLLLRQPLGRYLIVAGAVVAILTYLRRVHRRRTGRLDRAHPAVAADRQRGADAAAHAPRTGCWTELNGSSQRRPVARACDGGVVVHQLDPPRAAEVDQRHR